MELGNTGLSSGSFIVQADSPAAGDLSWESALVLSFFYSYLCVLDGFPVKREEEVGGSRKKGKKVQTRRKEERIGLPRQAWKSFSPFVT